MGLEAKVAVNRNRRSVRRLLDIACSMEPLISSQLEGSRVMWHQAFASPRPYGDARLQGTWPHRRAPVRVTARGAENVKAVWPFVKLQTPRNCAGRSNEPERFQRRGPGSFDSAALSSNYDVHHNVPCRDV